MTREQIMDEIAAINRQLACEYIDIEELKAELARREQVEQ